VLLPAGCRSGGLGGVAVGRVGDSFTVGEIRGNVMKPKEKAEHKRLHKLWATGKATMRQMGRCMELDRKVRAAK
jgi:hypothetical protein